MNTQELPIENKQSNGVSTWQVHDYANSLINDVMGMQYNQDTPANARILLERVQGTDHPMEIGKLIRVLKELESEMEILSNQTWETEKSINAWNVPQDGEVKAIYDVRYPLPSKRHDVDKWFNVAHPTICNSTGKYITYNSGSSDYPSGHGYDS